MPSFDSGNDFVWVCGPREGFWVIVGLVEEAVDGGLKFADRSEDTAFETASGELGEEALDGIEPRGRGGREMEGETRMAIEPFADLRVLMGGIVIEDDVDGLFGRDLSLDRKSVV